MKQNLALNKNVDGEPKNKNEKKKKRKRGMYSEKMVWQMVKIDKHFIFYQVEDGIFGPITNENRQGYKMGRLRRTKQLTTI